MDQFLLEMFIFGGVALVFFGFTFTRAPTKLSVLPPDGELFPTDRFLLVFEINYESKGTIKPRLKTFDFSQTYAEATSFGVPKGAKLKGLTIFYRDGHTPSHRTFNQTFWKPTFRIPENVENIKAIALSFSLPDDKYKWGHTVHFRLI